MDNKETPITILSIDAWADPSGWQWNAWYKVGSIDRATLATLDTDAKILEYMRDEGYISDRLEFACVEDDQYNHVIYDRTAIDAPEDCDECDCSEHQHSARPIFAIAYGEAE